jgi:hypothetical protein
LYEAVAMKMDNFNKISICAVLLAVIFCLFTIGISYHIHISAKTVQNRLRQSIESIQQDVLGLDARLAKLDISLTRLQNRFVTEPALRNTAKTENARLIEKKIPITSQSQSLKRLEQILDLTGLRQLAENGEVDAQFLQKIHDEYVYRDQIESYRDNLVQKNRTLHGIDDQNYDEQLQSLYQRARHFRGTDANPADREKAFGEMLEKYPDANATGMVIAERAFRSAFRGNISEAENFYSLLHENDNFSNVVTDRGIEAVPNLQYYLAQRYIRDGRAADAQVMLNSLEENYTDSYVRTRGQGYRPRWQPVSQVVDSLYQQIK